MMTEKLGRQVNKFLTMQHKNNFQHCLEVHISPSSARINNILSDILTIPDQAPKMKCRVPMSSLHDFFFGLLKFYVKRISCDFFNLIYFSDE
jgi:hypothetical protein